jgi:hypothetical protein
VSVGKSTANTIEATWQLARDPQRRTIRGLAKRRFHGGHDIGRIGEAAQLLLGDELVVEPNREFAGATDAELGIETGLSLQFSRHTGSLGPIASSATVFDRDRHT